MKNTYMVLALLLAVVGPAMAAIVAPATAPRMGGNCVWANGKVYWYLGRSSSSYGPDSSEKMYPRDYQAGISIYTPGSGWVSSKWDHTGPLGFDSDGDGLCEVYAPDYSLWASQKSGVWPESNQGVAYDKDNDGVAEIFAVMGGGQNENQIWRYDPNASARGTWSLETSCPLSGADNPSYVAFRRGAVGLYGTKVYFAAGSWGGRFGSYDFSTGVWSFYDDGPGSNQAAGTTVNGKLYVVGGTVNSGTSIWECDLTRPEIRGPVWSNSGAPVATLNTGVGFPSVVGYNGKVYVLGGYKADGTASNAIQVYTPGAGVVTSAAVLPFARWGFGACVDPTTGTLYVGAGTDGGDDPDNYTGWWRSGPPFYPSNVYSDWWKCDLDDATPTFTAIASDPAYFPYEDWDPGTDISGTVLGADSQPVPFAVVGVKPQPSPYGPPNAMADVDLIQMGNGLSYGGGQYITADANGHFGPINVPRGGTWYIGAWKEGWSPSTDTTVVVANNDPIVLNPQLTKLAGRNIVLNTANFVVSTNDGHPGANAFDGNLSTYWASAAGPDYRNPPPSTDYVLVDLDRSTQTNKAISGMTWWSYGDSLIGGGGVEYTVDAMTGGDPLNTAVWANPGSYGATVTRVYGTWGLSRGGYMYDQGALITVNPIRFAQGTVARGLRINLNAYRWPSNYFIRELQVHSATEYGGLVFGHVKDASGNPIYNAAVQIGGVGGQFVITDATGYYSFAATSATSPELYADAPGYYASVATVTIPSDGTPLVRDIVLTANTESVVYNSGFEVANGSKPDGWKTMLLANNGYPISGSSWDYNWDAVTRSTAFNATPGGGACGRIHTGTPLSSPWPPNVNVGQAFTMAGVLTTNNPIPVNPSRTYNFYFKSHRSATLSPGTFWRLTWLDAAGNYTGGGLASANDGKPASNNWEQIGSGVFPDRGWSNTYPMLRVTPPANAAFASIRLGIYGGNLNSSSNCEVFFDDVVLDPVVPAP